MLLSFAKVSFFLVSGGRSGLGSKCIVALLFGL